MYGGPPGAKPQVTVWRKAGFLIKDLKKHEVFLLFDKHFTQSHTCINKCIFDTPHISTNGCDILQQSKAGEKVPSSQERIVVFSRKTGKFLTGPNAPTATTLQAFLEKHPTFEVVRPGQSVGSPATFYSASM